LGFPVVTVPNHERTAFSAAGFHPVHQNGFR
jgi:hypothetical protein